MATTCGKHATKKEARAMWDLLAEDDFSISDYPDPFDNPANVVSPPWTTYNKQGKPIQVNQKIVRGPDQGVHRFVVVGGQHAGRTGETGILRDTEEGLKRSQ